MKSYRIFLPLFLLFFVVGQKTLEADTQSISQTQKDKFKVAGKVKVTISKKKKIRKKPNPLSMFAQEIHPGDKMLINNFGKKVGFDPKDFSKVDEKVVCSKKACKKDVNQSTCYRGFRGDINNPEKGCQGYQRRTMGKSIGKIKKEPNIYSSGPESQKRDAGVLKPSRKKSGGKGQIEELNDAQSTPEVTENNTSNLNSSQSVNPAATIAGIGGATVLGGLAMNNFELDDDGTKTGTEKGIHAIFAPPSPANRDLGSTGFSSVDPSAVPPAAACSKKLEAEELGREIKKIHTDELKRRGSKPMPGSNNPKNSHQLLYNSIVSQLKYLSSITDKELLNSSIYVLTEYLKILIKTKKIQSHFSDNLANKIMSAVSCVKNIGKTRAMNQSIGWMANAMAD